MVLHIYHCSCPKKTEGNPDPEYKWDGFSMANHADFACDTCGDILMIEEETDSDVLKRNYQMKLLAEIRDKNDNLVRLGDYVKIESFEGRNIAGIVTIISEYNIGMNTNKTHYSRMHNEVEKISQDEFMIYKLEN